MFLGKPGVPRPVGDDLMDYTGGSGLGLKIVRDIAEAYDGSAYLTEAEPPFVTSIRFEVRSATDEELEEYEG
jgi:signal transduction histidine kinase